MFKKMTFLVSLALLMSTQAYATILFTPSVTYLEQKLTDNSNPEVNAKLTLIDLRLGYVTSFGLYLGGMYSVHDQNITENASDSYFGPSIGYYNSGFLFVGTYFLYGERDLTSGTGKYSGINGFQLDFSYSIPLTEMISIGPQLTYHSIKFDDLQVSGISSATDYSFNGVTPYFNITFMFTE